MIAKKNKMIVARISQDDWDKLNILAKTERRTLSDFVRIILEDRLRNGK